MGASRSSWSVNALVNQFDRKPFNFTIEEKLVKYIGFCFIISALIGPCIQPDDSALQNAKSDLKKLFHEQTYVIADYRSSVLEQCEVRQRRHDPVLLEKRRRLTHYGACMTAPLVDTWILLFSVFDQVIQVMRVDQFLHNRNICPNYNQSWVPRDKKNAEFVFKLFNEALGRCTKLGALEGELTRLWLRADTIEKILENQQYVKLIVARDPRLACLRLYNGTHLTVYDTKNREEMREKLFLYRGVFSQFNASNVEYQACLASKSFPPAQIGYLVLYILAALSLVYLKVVLASESYPKRHELDEDYLIYKQIGDVEYIVLNLALILEIAAIISRTVFLTQASTWSSSAALAVLLAVIEIATILLALRRFRERHSGQNLDKPEAETNDTEVQEDDSDVEAKQPKRKIDVEPDKEENPGIVSKS